MYYITQLIFRGVICEGESWMKLTPPFLHLRARVLTLGEYMAGQSTLLSIAPDT